MIILLSEGRHAWVTVYWAVQFEHFSAWRLQFNKMGILKGHLKVICFDVRHCWFPWRACGSCLCSYSSKNVLTTQSSCKALPLVANSTSLQEGDGYSGSLEDGLEAACQDFLWIPKTLLSVLLIPVLASAENYFDIVVTSQLGFLAFTQENPACWSLVLLLSPAVLNLWTLNLLLWIH